MIDKAGLAQTLSGETEMTWDGMLQETRDFWLIIANRAEDWFENGVEDKRYD